MGEQEAKKRERNKAPGTLENPPRGQRGTTLLSRERRRKLFQYALFPQSTFFFLSRDFAVASNGQELRRRCPRSTNLPRDGTFFFSDAPSIGNKRLPNAGAADYRLLPTNWTITVPGRLTLTGKSHFSVAQAANASGAANRSSYLIGSSLFPIRRFLLGAALIKNGSRTRSLSPNANPPRRREAGPR